MSFRVRGSRQTQEPPAPLWVGWFCIGVALGGPLLGVLLLLRS